MPRGTRREFLASLTTIGAFALAARTARAQSGLDKFTVAAPPCKDDLTPAVPAGPEFKAGAPVRPSLREAAVAGKPMKLSGYVTGLSCGRIKDARIDFWHADPTGKYDMNGNRFRGAVLTGADGKYSLETTVPGSVNGRARRIHARIQPPGKPVLSTVLFFPDDPAATRDKTFKPSLAMKAASGENAFTFDFLLDA